MTTQRLHVYDLLGPTQTLGPGRAYRARAGEATDNVAQGTEVLLRVIDLETAGSEEVLAQLEHGLRLAVGIDCDAASIPIDVGREDDQVWWASRMESGRSLGDLLDAVPSLPDPLAESIASQIATALDAAHSRGLHGICISTDSVLVRDDSSVVVQDLAVGPVVRANWPQKGQAPASMLCASPESVRGDRSDARSDLYSLGALLFRACSGRWHRKATAIEEIRESPEQPDGARLSEHKSDRSPFLVEVIRTLLKATPADRFQSVSQLWEALIHRRDSTWWNAVERREPDAAMTTGPTSEKLPTEPAPLPIPEPAALPTQAWIVHRVQRRRRLAPHVAPCRGRDRERRALLERLQQVGQGGKGGGVLLLEGEAGAGKTRLLDAFLEDLSELPEEELPILLVGEHRHRGVGRPLQAFSEALTAWLGETREVREEDVRLLLGSAAGIAPAFTAFLSGHSAPRGVPPLSRESLAAAFGNTLSTLCSFRPVLFVVENLQWADPEGLDLFGYLARRAGRMPVLLLATHRPARDGTPLASLMASVASLDHSMRTHLVAPVTSHTVELVTELVEPAAQAEALGANIHASCGGNPHLVVETLHLLAGEGILAKGEEREWKADDLPADMDLPPDLERLYDRRLDAVSANARVYLEMASVQGVMFDTDVVRIALGWDPPKAVEVLEELEEAQLVFGDGPGRRFASHGVFLHVGDGLGDVQLNAHHDSTAEAFLTSRNPQKWDPDQCHGMLCYRVAWHYLSAEKLDEGLRFVHPALDHLRDTWRIGDAERLAFRAAHALRQFPDRVGDQVEMLMTRAELLGLEGRRDEQGRVLDEALLLCRAEKDRAREARVLLASTKLFFVTHRMKRARETGRETLALAHTTGQKRVEARCQYLLGSIAYHEARYQDARQRMQRAQEVSRDLLDSETEAEALQALGTISQGVGSYEHAVELQHMAMRLYRERGDLAHEAETLTSLGNIAAATGDFDQAEQFLRRALNIQRAMANGYAEAQILSHLGMLLQDQGRFIEARSAHRECLEVSRDMGAEAQEIVANLNLAAASYVLGSLDAARDHNGDALRAARPARDPRLIGYALTGLGEVARQRGEWEVAQDLYKRAVRQFRKVDDIHGLAAALLGAGRIELVCGEPGESEELLVEAVGAGRARGARRSSRPWPGRTSP